MAPKVALLTPASLVRPDGGGLRVLAQARGLWAAGFRDFTVFCREPNPELPFDQARARVYGPAQFIFDRVRGFDLIHAHQNAGLFQEGRLWADLHGFALLECRLAWRERPWSARALALMGLSAWALPRLLGRAERLLCAAPSIAENLRRAFPSAPPVSILNNAINPDLYPPSSCAEAAVGVIGGFTSRWGRPAFELALATARLCPGLPFRLVGAAIPAQRAQAAQLPNVELLGEVSTAAYCQFFNTVSLALMPYPAWCRGGGSRLKLLESAASGLAVVGTPAGWEGFSAGEAVLTGHTPSELAAHLAQLAANPAERAARGQALRALVTRHHDETLLGQRLAELYQSL